MSRSQQPSRWWIKVRRRLSGLEPALLIGCLLLVLAGGWLVYGGVVATGTTTEQVEYGSIDYEGTFEYSAVVTEETAVYDVGDRLTGQPVYYTGVSPTVEGEYALAFSSHGTDGTEVDVTLYRVLRSTADSGVVIWERQQQLGRETVSSDSGTASVPFSVDIPTIEQDIQAIQGELGASPGEVQSYIRAEITILGAADGQSERITETVRFGISPNGETFTLDPEQVADTQTIGTTRTVTQSPSYLQGGIGGLLILLGLGGGAVVYRAYSRDVIPLSPQEQSWLQYREDYTQFEEWITTISLPESARELPAAAADSLGDLVDFAIDTDNSVIEDPETGNYYVIYDGTRYEYIPPSPPASQPEWRDLVMDSSGESTPDQEAES